MKAVIVITGYTHPKNWYADKIGEKFVAHLAADGGYTLLDEEHYYYHVNSCDCCVVRYL